MSNPSRTELLIEPTRQYLTYCSEHVRAAPMLKTRGRLVRVAGLVMEATGLSLPVGSTCMIVQESGQQAEAEVVGF